MGILTIIAIASILVMLVLGLALAMSDDACGIVCFILIGLVMWGMVKGSKTEWKKEPFKYYPIKVQKLEDGAERQICFIDNKIENLTQTFNKVLPSDAIVVKNKNIPTEVGAFKWGIGEKYFYSYILPESKNYQNAKENLETLNVE